MFSILLLLFTVIPALEIYLLFNIGAQIGGLNTLFIVLFTGFTGAYLAKSQGLQILSRIQEDLSRGAVPANEFIHGLLVFGGGLLLLTPGFLTDIMGIAMVFPVTRIMIAHFFKSYFERAIQSGNVQFYSFSSGTRNQQESPGPNRQVGPDTYEAEFKKK
ncbi:FxsA family protein [Bacteriovorax sp. Seq25_V]|uniref:FxsA family protein n=1 Tax=Bacteriovorax sp. Seq25_V TaxID=1201288 RepID=UPI000389F836|nr:FxsA family protein [Bacteriovorax sp. Seq25_V]EQC48005.1 FxsA cytoplasmic membrane protein [Bacteriovorax sp. Seq25_V]